MAFSDVSICNMALGHICHTRFISSLSERSNEVSVCNAFYEPARDYTLEAYPWPFATKYETLGLVQDFTALTTPHDWGYSYRYPSDCVYARRLVTTNGRTEPNPPPFKIGGDTTARLLYTDEEDAVLEYTRLITDPSLFSAAFAMALSWWLAGLIAPGLSKDAKRATGCFQMFQALTSQAEARAGNEQQQTPEPDSEFMRERQ